MELLTLALVGLLALIAPLISRLTEVPCVVLEIALGIVFGQSVLGLIAVEGPWTTFLFDFGLIYLLFMAGLE
ncbi:MAG: sodium:proton antiporter, partial [Thermoproteota archaeon]